MLNLSRRAVLTGGALLGTVAIAVPTLAAPGDGGGTPANKAVAAGSTIKTVTQDGVVELMSASLKTSKPTDLIMAVTLECSILTNTIIEGSPEPGAVGEAEARGAVRVWVTLDGKIVPINDASTPPQDPAASGNGGDKDKVTFCDRLHRRSVSDEEDPQDGIDGSEDYLETKSANGFNWLRLNAGSGMHEVKVFAEFTTQSVAPSTAEAFVGNRSLIIEPTKLANAAVIAEDGTSSSGS